MMDQPDLQRIVDAAELLCLSSEVSDVLEPFGVTISQLTAATLSHVNANTKTILAAIEQAPADERHALLRAHLTGQILRGMVIGRVFGRREQSCASQE